MSIIHLLNKKWFGPCLVGLLCVLMVSITTPRKAAAVDTIEYGLLIAIILIVVSSVAVDTAGWNNARANLQTSVDKAALANEEGNRPKEIGALGKANGAESAMMGMTANCVTADCDTVRANLQDAIALTGMLRGRALGNVDDCQIDGVIGSHEECDPLAESTGCPLRASFCNEECECDFFTLE